MNSNQSSILILPFRNGSAGSEYEFLSDGITEEIIMLLSSNRNLKVISRKSAFSLKSKTSSIENLQNNLEIDFVVEGMVRLKGSTIRINAKLIEAKDNVQIWSGKWDRKVESIFGLEDEIALLISDQIREHVGHFEITEEPIYRQKLEFEVYQTLLEAKSLFYKWNPKDVEKSIELFLNVLDAAPNNIDALIGLSDAYSFMATANLMNPAEAWELSIKYAEIASNLNPNHAGVNYLKSHGAFFTKGNFKEALSYAHTAIQINPAYPEALQFLSFFYSLALDKETAKKYLDSALLIDPLNPETLFFKGIYDYRFGRYDEAIKQFDQLIQENPLNLPAIVSKSYALIKTKRYNENLKFIDSISQDLLIPDERLGLLCVTHAASGSKELELYLPKLKIAAADSNGLQAKCYLYWTNCLNGNVKQAIQIARNMIADKISLILIHFADPIVESVLDDKEFKSLFNELYRIEHCAKKVSTKTSSPEIQNSNLEKDAEIVKRHMEEMEAFLNPKLSLRDLAANLEIHPNQLSLVLNSVFNQNFNAFVNNYRINYFKRLIKEQQSSNFSLIGLAYESGFNSKTVFNTYFKKVEGITPGEYLKNQ